MNTIPNLLRITAQYECHALPAGAVCLELLLQSRSTFFSVMFWPERLLTRTEISVVHRTVVRGFGVMGCGQRPCLPPCAPAHIPFFRLVAWKDIHILAGMRLHIPQNGDGLSAEGEDGHATFSSVRRGCAEARSQSRFPAAPRFSVLPAFPSWRRRSGTGPCSLRRGRIRQLPTERAGSRRRNGPRRSV